MKVQIDCYGFEAASEHFQKRKLHTFLVKETDGVVYECFGPGTMRPVHRIDRDPDGCVSVMWAYGDWGEAEDLAYVPINETIMIDRED